MKTFKQIKAQFVNWCFYAAAILFILVVLMLLTLPDLIKFLAYWRIAFHH